MRHSITVVTVAFGDLPGLGDAVDAVLRSEDVDVDVIVVDNGATGATAALLTALASQPAVTVLDGGGNRGFGAACNVGAAVAIGNFLGFVNPDVLVAPDALVRLVDALAETDVGIATASVRLAEDDQLLNSSGGAIHFLGLGWAEDFRKPWTVAATDRDVLAASGAAMVLRRDRFLDLGGFTEELFLYHEDAELSLRCWMRGWRVRFVAAAVARHEYEFGRNARKLELLERNRLIVVLTCYGARFLLLVLPALMAYEVGICLVAMSQGWFGEKVSGWRWLVQHRRWLRRRRREVQAGRLRSDRDLAPMFAERFTAGQLDLPSALEPADRALAAYWRFVRTRI